MRTRVVYCPWNRNNPYALERSDDHPDAPSTWTTFAIMDNREEALAAARAYLSYPLVLEEFSALDAPPLAVPEATP